MLNPYFLKLKLHIKVIVCNRLIVYMIYIHVVEKKGQNTFKCQPKAVILLNINETWYNILRNVFRVSLSKVQLLMRRVFILGTYAGVIASMGNSNPFFRGSQRVLNFWKYFKICSINAFDSILRCAKKLSPQPAFTC